MIFASPFNKRGIAKTCIGEGTLNPLRSIAVNVCSSNPKSSNEISASSVSSAASTDVSNS